MVFSTPSVRLAQLDLEKARMALYGSLENYLTTPVETMKTYVMMDIEQMRAVLNKLERDIKSE